MTGLDLCLPLSEHDLGLAANKQASAEPAHGRDLALFLHLDVVIEHQVREERLQLGRNEESTGAA